MSQVTKRALEASLKNLLLQKPLSKITISDITEDCGINRMTFYYTSRTFTTLSSGRVRRTPARRSQAIRPTRRGSRVFCSSLRPCRTTSHSL